MSKFAFTAMIAPAGLTAKPDYSDIRWVAQYLDSFEAQDLTISDLASEIEHGNGYANVFSGRAGKRDGFVMGSLICIDMDHGEGAAFAALVSHPYVLAYAAIVHPTLSSTPEAPRHRVVFVLDEPIYGEAAYTYAAQTITDLFPGADRACAYAGRTFLGNGKPDWAAFHYANNTLPIQQVRLLARQKKARELEAWGQQRQAIPSAEPPELSELFRKLAPIDPYSFSYDEWLKIGAALAHTYGDDAFLSFKEWSDRAGKQPLTWAKWKSLTLSHPRPASIGSIIYLLQEKGVA